ncbi:MAG: hypothetical protein HZC42_03760 [Candidatus Eisenbacteria bacterium]|nr:hypothetical protein [Candidatus Eisenbacteria bacterium]
MPWFPPARHLAPRLGRAAAAALLAALTFATAHAQEPVQRAPDGVPIPREVRLQAMRQLKHDLLWQGARRHFTEVARRQREARELKQRGKPAPTRGQRVREAFVDDGPLPAGSERLAAPAAAEATAVVPTNVRANTPGGDSATAGQAEECIASLGSNILVAWNDGQGFVTGGDTQGYAYSTDNGATFTDGGDLPHPAAYPSWKWTSDPVVAVNEKTGRFFYCGLANSDASNNAVGVAYGHFSGASFVWDSVVAVRTASNATTFLDKQWIAADSSGTGQMVYVSNTTFDTSDHIDFYRSTDGGRTWSLPTQLSPVSENGAVQGSRPAVGPGGELYVVWSALGAGDADFFNLKKSTNSGASFGAESQVVSLYANAGTGAPGFNRERGITFPSIVVDRTTGVNRGRVYVGWNESVDVWAAPFSLNSGKVEVEPNGYALAATLFTPGQTLRGNTSAVSPADLDYWKFSLTAGQVFVVWADSLPASQTYTLRVFAPNPDSTQRLCFGGDINAGTNVTQAWYGFCAPVTATYYLRFAPAYTSSSSKTGNYRIETAIYTPTGERSRDQRDAFVTWSDNGSSWSTPVRANDSAVGFDEWLPEVAVGADGCAYATWFDWRDDTYGSRGHQYGTRSTDGGATWQPSAMLTSAQSNFTTSSSNIAPNQGDYSSSFGDARYVRHTWADGRGSNVDVWTTGWDTWQVITVCAANQTVIPNMTANLAWTVTNNNPLFANDYTCALSSQRNWPMPANVPLALAAAAFGDANMSVAVPDTAAAGINLLTFTVTNSRGALVKTCTTSLTVDPSLVGVGGGQPLAFGLRPSWPNPARCSARLEYTLPRAGAVTLRIYGLKGELVRTLVSGERPAGLNAAVWDGRDERGNAVGAGAYFYRLEGFGRSAARRMVWMR